MFGSFLFHQIIYLMMRKVVGLANVCVLQNIKDLTWL